MTKSLVPPDTKVGDRFLITFTDVSKHLFVNAIEDKTAGTVIVVVKKYFNWIASHFHISVKRFHTDNGGEYVKRLYEGICRQ
jgi:hypothetical protein